MGMKGVVLMGADFTPHFDDYTNIAPFRFYCQTVLPTVYDDSLSYYELLNKVVQQLNDVINATNELGSDVTAMLNAYEQLQKYVNDYFDNLDVQEEINNKLDEMATAPDGQLITIVDSFMMSQAGINMVRTAVNDNLDTNLSPMVDSKLPAVVSSSISGGSADTQIASTVNTWLNNNVDPVGSAVTVDESLLIGGSAADSKVVGELTQFPSPFVPILLCPSRIDGNNTVVYDGSNTPTTSLEDPAIVQNPVFTATSGTRGIMQRVDKPWECTLSDGDDISIGAYIELKTQTDTVIYFHFSSGGSWGGVGVNHADAQVNISKSGYYSIPLTYTHTTDGTPLRFIGVQVASANVKSVMYFLGTINNINPLDYTLIDSAVTLGSGLIFSGAYHEIFRYTDPDTHTQRNEGANGDLGCIHSRLSPAGLINELAETGNYHLFFRLNETMDLPATYKLPFSVVVVPKAEYSGDSFELSCGFTTVQTKSVADVDNDVNKITFTVKGVTTQGTNGSFAHTGGADFKWFFLNTSKANMAKIDSVYVTLGEWGRLVHGGVDYDLVCWGDSLTVGSGGDGTNYLTVINQVFPNAKTYNGGVGGDTAAMVGFSAGAGCLIIPAGVDPSEEFTPDKYNDLVDIPRAIPPAAANFNYFNVDVEGVSYPAYKDTTSTLHLGNLTTVKNYPRNMRISNIVKGNVTIIWAGTNGTRTYEFIYPKIDNIIASLPNQNYIVCGLCTDGANIESVNEQLAARYGQKFLDIKSYILEYGLTVAEITPTQQDLADIAANHCPTSLMDEGSRIHFNADGYTVIGKLMVDKLRGLGYDIYLK